MVCEKSIEKLLLYYVVVAWDNSSASLGEVCLPREVCHLSIFFSRPKHAKLAWLTSSKKAKNQHMRSWQPPPEVRPSYGQLLVGRDMIKEKQLALKKRALFWGSTNERRFGLSDLAAEGQKRRAKAGGMHRKMPAKIEGHSKWKKPTKLLSCQKKRVIKKLKKFSKFQKIN